MLPLRVTALGLTGLLLVATPSSLALEPAEASALTSAASAKAPATEPAMESRVTPAASKDSGRAEPIQSQLLPATSLKRPKNGEEAVRRLGADLPDVARAHDMRPAQLRNTLRNDETLWVAASGQLFVKEEPHAAGTFNDAETAAATAPLDQTFALHSLPGSQHTIYLDFDGVDLTAASSWTSVYPLPAGSYEGWDPMNDGPAFSDAERTAIQEIWASVAEDYAPFDVNVTTADPGEDALRVDAPGDPEFGTRLVITDSTQVPTVLCNNQCGGVAWVGQIDTPAAVAEPAWVFSTLTSQSPKVMAEAASHEVGHTFGLLHDGIDHGDGNWEEYYSGHGTWAPIMGSSYDAPVTQWSNGTYTGAYNHENDVEVIGAISGFRTDEGGDGWSSPLRVTDQTSYVGSSSDGDVYLVDDCSTGARVAAVTTGFPANLDVSLTLARPSGTGTIVVTTVNPLVTKVDGVDERPWYGTGVGYLSSSAAGLDASVDVPEGGPWLLEVRGGEGLTSDDGSTDYFTYGSLGAYRLEVEGCTTPMVAPARPTGLELTTSGSDLVATWAAPSNDGGSPVTGYRLTLNGMEPVDLAADATTHTFPGAATVNATVAVRALNAIGAGAAATASANPTTVPSQVTDVEVVTDDVTCDFGGGNIQRCIKVSWNSPASNGGTPVTGYQLQQSDDGQWLKLFDYESTGGYESKTTRFNPVAGEKISYRIVALNANGAGEPYGFEALLKGQPARITPTITTDRDDRTVTVTWDTPFDGGEPIERTYLTLTTGNFSEPVSVTLAPDATSYTFNNVKTGSKHLLIAASNVWGPVAAGSGNGSDVSFDMPPISPDPGHVDGNTIQATVLDKATGSLRVTWDPVVPADPVHDPVLWYDVCVDVIGEIHLPGDAGFGDGTTRGSDLCGDRTTVALTADATEAPYIDLHGLTLENHMVTVTPVNPGGPGFMPAMREVSFAPTAITCPTEFTVHNGQLTWTWEWPGDNVNDWDVRARRLPETAWTVWASHQAYYLTGVYQQPVTPGEWEIEVTAHLRNGHAGAPVACAVTVPEPQVVDPDPDPEPEPEPEPIPEPPTPPTVDPVPTTPVPTTPTTAPDPGPATPVLAGPSAPRLTKVKPGSKGGAKTIALKWSAPSSAGSSAVKSYQVIVYKVRRGKLVVKARTTVPASKLKLTLKLKRGTYKFAVRAKNADDWSSLSAVSKSIEPR